ncbi:hypothetical protein [Dyadobacter bucti]|uniref:hypothetical protein n=1 Tax=Dyadobacter bucti TaxID=2572203 RepID=UPI003F6F5001
MRYFVSIKIFSFASFALIAIMTTGKGLDTLAQNDKPLYVEFLNSCNVEKTNEELLINFTNQTATNIERIRYTIFGHNQRNLTDSLAILSPHQTTARIVKINSDIMYKYVKVTYSLRGIDNSAFINYPVAPSSNDESIFKLIFPTVASVIGIIIGAILLHIFTNIREKSRAKFDWKKIIFDKYEQAYISFLHDWQESQSPTLLETHFDKLTKNAIVPFNIVTQYKKTIATLQDTNSDPALRKNSCDQLRLFIDKELLTPMLRR